MVSLEGPIHAIQYFNSVELYLKNSRPAWLNSGLADYNGSRKGTIHICWSNRPLQGMLE